MNKDQHSDQLEISSDLRAGLDLGDLTKPIESLVNQFAEAIDNVLHAG